MRYVYEYILSIYPHMRTCIFYNYLFAHVLLIKDNNDKLLFIFHLHFFTYYDFWKFICMLYSLLIKKMLEITQYLLLIYVKLRIYLINI